MSGGRRDAPGRPHSDIGRGVYRVGVPTQRRATVAILAVALACIVAVGACQQATTGGPPRLDEFMLAADPAIESYSIEARTIIGPIALDEGIVMGVRAGTTAGYARDVLCPQLASKLRGNNRNMWFEIRLQDGTVLAWSGDC